MADVDEDEFPRGPAHAGEVDLTEETQDFRFLMQFSYVATRATSHRSSRILQRCRSRETIDLTCSRKTSAPIPKRGDKDFEPHNTNLQAATLEASRQAMHDALAAPRTHISKSRISAVFQPDPNGAWVEQAKGPHFKTMGQTVKSGRTWLWPEEALYLLDRGALDMRWPDIPVGDDDAPAEGVTMSLQGAYAAFIGMDTGPAALTLERYTVYAALKRAGYAVFRGEGWDGSVDAWNDERLPERAPPEGRPSWGLGILTELWHKTFGPSDDSAKRAVAGPLVPPGVYRSYGKTLIREAPPKLTR